MSHFKKAFVSVSDKTNLVELLSPLVKNSLEIYSTGSTAAFLKKNGIKTHLVSDLTGFEEVMEGRVKTLHPYVYMGLLYRKDKDEKLLEKYKIPFFDLLVVNLYPFESSLKEKKSLDQMIEHIDVGGVSLLRAAAKNFKEISVLCDPKDYSLVSKKPDLALRKKLAAKAFSHTSYYDHLIQSYLSEDFSDYWSFSGKDKKTLRYGENPQSEACFYKNPLERTQFHFFQGKELSFNNFLDIDACLKTISLFKKPCFVAVKHTNPCSVSEASSLDEAILKGLKADPQSIFGGVICVNEKVEKKHALMFESIFFECLLAPSYTDEALEVFKKKKNLRVLSYDLDQSYPYDLRMVSGGFLVQKKDEVREDFLKDKKIPEKIKEDMIFSWKVAARLKSNSISIVSKGQTLGLGMGQVSRIDACEQAISRWKKFHPEKKEVVLASDGFFPFTDSIDLIAKNKISYILQPGGSLKDDEVKRQAEKLGIHMILTGKRHFLH